MKRAADENREQTRIMTENLRSEGDRQVYVEADVLLYSLALYMVANADEPSVSGFGSIFGIYKNIAEGLNKNNSDGVFPVVRNRLEWFLRAMEGKSATLSPKAGPMIDYCREQLSLLCESEKFSSNTLVATRIESLGIRTILSLIRSVKAT
jgi:hypothetical protein